MKILTEASGSLTSGYIINAIKEANYQAVASDITESCFAKYLADEFIVMPKISEEFSWEKTIQLIKKYKIDVVIPTLDEALILWADCKNQLFKENIKVIISDKSTIEVFQDKWKTYLFFKEHNIPTPQTSLQQTYNLIKPRFGRGSTGIFQSENDVAVNMEGNISQEIIKGTEYTIDVFCDVKGHPVYIVPRKRLQVKDGKSTGGIVVKHDKIEQYINEICSKIKFNGPINIQCFEEDNGDIKFIEINPRLAGGMALGFAATENWINLIVKHYVYNESITPVNVKYGLKMMRYYHEIFAF